MQINFQTGNIIKKTAGLIALTTLSEVYASISHPSLFKILSFVSRLETIIVYNSVTSHICTNRNHFIGELRNANGKVQTVNEAPVDLHKVGTVR